MRTSMMIFILKACKDQEVLRFREMPIKIGRGLETEYKIKRLKQIHFACGA